MSRELDIKMHRRFACPGVRIGPSTNIRACVRAQLTFWGHATFRLVGPPSQNYFTLKTIQLLSGHKIKLSKRPWNTVGDLGLYNEEFQNLGLHLCGCQLWQMAMSIRLLSFTELTIIRFITNFQSSLQGCPLAKPPSLLLELLKYFLSKAKREIAAMINNAWMCE